MKSEDPPATQVAVPHLQGRTECSWIPKQDQVLPPELEEVPQITVPLSVADPHHWNIANDPIFPSCIATFRARHEATLASGTAASSGGASSQGGGSTPLQELPSASQPLPPPTSPLEWQEVDKRVTEVMDQVHDLQLQLLQEIGFVWEIDQALSKSLMVEFLRLKVIIGDDLSGALRTWQTDMEVATDKLVRDLDAATQTSTTLPSKNAAVEVALCQFRAASQLRVALPLTQLDEAREEMETFIQFRLEELRSPQETKNLMGNFPPGLRAIGAECMGCCVANLSGIPRSLRSSWLVWQQTGPSKAISSPASWRDYWGALAWPPQGRVILPSPPVRALAMHGPQPYIEQSPKLNRRRLRHQKWWGCLPTGTSSTKRAYLINKDISYHPSSRTRSSSLTWLRQCSGWQSPWWCPSRFLPPVAAKCHPPHLSQGVVGPSSRY